MHICTDTISDNEKKASTHAVFKCVPFNSKLQSQLTLSLVPITLPLIFLHLLGTPIRHK